MGEVECVLATGDDGDDGDHDDGGSSNDDDKIAQRKERKERERDGSASTVAGAPTPRREPWPTLAHGSDLAPIWQGTAALPPTGTRFFSFF